MKVVSYAGQQLVTTDGVAAALVTLAAAIAREGDSAVLEIPILLEGKKEAADLIVGVGNDVLVGPHNSTDPEPDFSAEVAHLTSHHLYPTAGVETTDPDDLDFGPNSGFNPTYHL